MGGPVGRFEHQSSGRHAADDSLTARRDADEARPGAASWCVPLRGVRPCVVCALAWCRGGGRRSIAPAQATTDRTRGDETRAYEGGSSPRQGRCCGADRPSRTVGRIIMTQHRASHHTARRAPHHASHHHTTQSPHHAFTTPRITHHTTHRAPHHAISTPRNQHTTQSSSHTHLLALGPQCARALQRVRVLAGGVTLPHRALERAQMFLNLHRRRW